MQQKIVLIGGPGTGKTSVINELTNRGYFCMPEISREVTLEAQKKGIDQLFLTEPLLFSKMLLEGREKQFLEANKSEQELVFFDRGIPDVHAYMDYFKTDYPATFFEKCNLYKYTKIFHFSPWKDIHTTDNERYESFEETTEIDRFLMKSYTDLGYAIINVPFGSLKERTDFVINSLACEL
ncbi:AAA family ATPase [Polaribacter sp. AHE13PA]|uniref:AAA family ATPase n=1 Tax=Polaribacter sp. AHE13PA TaxID=2745562 RepID=UPI001C4F2EA4|nr:ATP-binding protein [Polaribacter sp. AHE13PA]QXP68453.1 ATP-binding protein [Polaribacter sp. AHE13PA]